MMGKHTYLNNTYDILIEADSVTSARALAVPEEYTDECVGIALADVYPVYVLRALHGKEVLHLSPNTKVQHQALESLVPLTQLRAFETVEYDGHYWIHSKVEHLQKKWSVQFRRVRSPESQIKACF